jgi:nucleoside-diphosphate-sugar epimerase
MGKRIFITGGTGVNGGHLLNKLREKDCEVLVLTIEENYEFSSKNINALYGNLSKPEEWKDKLKEFKPDTVIHFAWGGIPYDYGPEMSIKNLRNSLNLILVLSEINCPRIISIGTCWEYGKNQGVLKESDSIKPSKPIALAKNSLHQMIDELAKEKGIISIWARFFYVYGPGRKETTLIPYIINCAKNNKDPELKNPFGSYDFIYSEDVANALLMIIEEGNKSATYNIGSGKSTSILDITKIIYRQLNIPCNLRTYEADERLYDNFWADISKIKREIGWEPKIILEEGLLNMVKQNE